ncbi:MAG: hypothetical protein JNM72_08860 [Deltaproteobacteria bacterium]|jgi:hypothetical protein|nr:hypothetical protein [Deltaproteobacteria bacterium]
MSTEHENDQELDAPAAAEAEVEAAPAPAAPAERSQVKQNSVLSRASDFVARPGFRNPPNQASKAQKKGGKKR